MSSVRKVLLGGAMVCAAALTAASTAWACSPGASASLDADAAPPGGNVNLTGRGFEADKGDIEIRWNTTSGTILARAVGASFTVPVTVPQKAPGDYFFAAVQRKADGSISWQAAVPIRVLAAAAPPPPAPSPPPGETPAPAAPTAAPVAPTPVADAQPVPVPQAGTPAVQPVTRRAQAVAPAAPRVQPAPAVATGQAGDSPSPALPAAAPLADPGPITVPVDDGLPATVSDLWSGLDEIGAPTLDAGRAKAPQGRSGPSPLGVGLVLVGLVGLAAGASAAMPAGRRALAARFR